MKHPYLLILAAAAMLQSAHGRPAQGMDPSAMSLEYVERMPALGRMHSWQAVDDDTLIVWARAHDPYLIELSWRSPGMRFAQVIGVTETAGSVHSRFDSVIIDGLRHRIDAIYKLSAQDAEAIRSNAKR